jgi:hypothetical protein
MHKTIPVLMSPGVKTLRTSSSPDNPEKYGNHCKKKQDMNDASDAEGKKSDGPAYYQDCSYYV